MSRASPLQSINPNTPDFLLNHVNIPIIHDHLRHSRLLYNRVPRLLSSIGVSSSRWCRFRPTPPIVLHLPIQFLLRLPRPSIYHLPRLPIPMTPLPPTTTPWAPISPPHRAPRPTPPPPRTTARRHIPIHALGRWFTRIRPPRRVWASTPIPRTPPSSSPSGLLNAFKQATTGFHGCIEGVAGCAAADVKVRAGGAGGEKGQADGLAVGIGAVELADRFAGVGEGGVGYEGGAGGAAGAVEAQGEGEDGTNAGEEVLRDVSAG